MNAEPPTDVRLEVPLCACFVFSLLLMLMLVAVASSQGIVLFLDAGYYLFEVIRTSRPAVFESTAATVQLLQQAPVLASLWAGLTDLRSILFLGGLSNLLLPLALTSGCYWVLPPDRKALFVFPLLAYLAGAMSAFFPTVTDAPPAAAYFWLLLFVLYFSDLRKRSAAALLVIMSIPSMWLHESFAFLGPVLAYVAATKMAGARAGRERRFYGAACAWFVAGSLVALYAIIVPRSEENRTGFLRHFFGGLWLHYDALNVAAVISSVALLLFGLYWIGVLASSARPALATRIFRVVAVGILAFAVAAPAMALATWLRPELYGYYAQFAARANATLVSFPLSIMWLAVANSGPHAAKLKSKSVAGLVLFLSLSIFLAHLAGLGPWTQYLDSYAAVLRSEQGLVSWQRARGKLVHADRLSNHGESWLNPVMSILLADRGEVRSIIDNTVALDWLFDPCQIDARSRLPIVDYRLYEEAIGSTVCAGRTSEFGSAAAWTPDVSVADFRLPAFPAMLTEAYGLSGPEEWGRWTDGDTLKLAFAEPLPEAFELSIVAAGFGPNIGKAVEVSVGNDADNLQTFVLQESPTTHRLKFRLRRPSASIQFRVPAPVSPAELGVGPDHRRLGIRLVELRLLVE